MPLTIADLCDSVIAEYEAIGRASIVAVQYRSKKHIKRLMGSIPAETLDTPDLHKYIGARRQEGAVNATINRELAIVRRGFRLHRKTLTSPMFPTLREAPPRSQYWTRQDFDAIAAELKPEVADAFHFAFLTGWRLASEVLPLTWEKVQWGDNGGVVLPWGSAAEGGSKSGEIRKFPFAGPIGQELVTLLKRRRRETPDNVKWVFHRDGERMRSVRSAFRYAKRRAQRPTLSPHDLRRTAMRNLLLHGMLLEMAMRLTGHKDPNVARRYAIFTDGDLEHAMKRMTRPDLPKNGDD